MTIDSEVDQLLMKLFEDLYAVPCHPTDIDACHLHEKHTPQCYGCRHAKWSNIIKAELRERFDLLNALQELKNLIAQEANKARLDELRLILAAREPGYMYKRIITDRIAQLTAEKGSNNG